MVACVNSFSVITLFCIFLVGCDVGQTNKPYEFKDEEKLPAEQTRPAQQTPPVTISSPRPSQAMREPRQDPNKSFAQDEGSVVRGRPINAFPVIQFPE